LSTVLLELTVLQIINKFPHFTEPEGPLLCSREPPIGLYIEPDELNPHLHKISSNITLPTTSRSSEWPLPFRFANHSFVWNFHLSCVCHIPRPYHPSWVSHPNNFGGKVKIMKLLIIFLEI